MQLKQNPYHLLLLTGVVLALLPFIVSESQTIDIHVHDTYYVIARGYVFWFFAFVVWLLWFVYIATGNSLYSKLLTWIHVVLTLLTVMLLLFLLNAENDTLSRQARDYLDFSNVGQFAGRNPKMKWIVYGSLALAFSQITYIINLLAGLFKRRT